MKKTKKSVLMAIFLLVVLVGIGALVWMRIGSNTFMEKQLRGGDLTVTNDTPDTFSTAFTRGGKTMSEVVHPGGKATGGKGLLRIFVAKKNGNYELQYPYPRPAGKPAEISLTQVLNAAHGNPQLGQELSVEKGKIDDIRVDYEEVRDLEATY
jgi:hypothetical protein